MFFGASPIKLRWWNYLFGCVVMALAASGLWLRFCQAEGLSLIEKTSLVESDTFANRLALSALERTKHIVRYDPDYVVIPYPGGDVPASTGVCTDVVIRSYRKLGIDLQKLVHEDMKANFSKYPKNWGLKKPDTNIDHRRVPNLQRFFTGHGESLEATKNADDYLPGDLVAWDLNGNNLWHIGIVVAPDKFVHNIGWGPKLDSGLFQWKVAGHYRYEPAVKETADSE